jgi:hypothetical protein
MLTDRDAMSKESGSACFENSAMAHASRRGINSRGLALYSRHLDEYKMGRTKKSFSPGKKIYFFCFVLF